MENQDKTTFSLDDDEIVEEEVIDRDEEYDDDDYDDEEEGEEEEAEDEDYDDYDEEDYDDGYNDDYYDDRLNKVLDEIAEIKRGMSSQTPAVQQTPSPQPQFMPPQYIYQQPTATPVPAGSEVVMYNEISRLRDELAKNQSNLEMQKEISRLKDDMVRDQKYAESQYNAEIKRLQDRIDDLLKNASSPQTEQLPAQQQQEPARLEGGKSEYNKTLDFEKLLSINEAVLRATKDSDARIQNEIAALKRKVDEFPSSEDLNHALASVKKAAASSDTVSADAIARLSNDIASLRAAIGEKNNAAASAPVAPAAPSVSTPIIVSGGASSDISASELLRQLYEIKNVLGSTSAAAVKRTQALLELISDYKKVSFEAHSMNVPFKDKLTEVFNYAKKLTESNEADSLELMDATNELIEGLAEQRLNREIFSDVSSFLSSKGKALPSSVRDSADRFFGICEKLADAKVDEYADYLPDLIAERNVLEENRRETENNEIFTKITDALFAENRDEDEIKDLVSHLTDLRVGDIAEFPLIGEPKSYKPSHTVGDETVLSKLAELKAIIEDSLVAKQETEEEEAEQEEERERLEKEEQERLEKEEQARSEKEEKERLEKEEAIKREQAASQEILNAVNELKAALATKATVTDAVSEKTAGVDDALQEIRTSYLDVSERLVDISEKLAEPVDADSQVMTEEEKQKTLDDLAYIHQKLDEQDTFISQIVDLRSDILNISSTIDFTEQYNSIVTEITAQFDKLYEDLSNVVIESESNITNRINEIAGAADAVEVAKADILADTQIIKDAIAGVSDGRADILADTQAILGDTQNIIADLQSVKDSLFIVTDTVSNTAVADAVEQLRTDLSSFADLTAANVDASTTDRQKLLDDVAFLREQAEAALSDNEQASTEKPEEEGENLKAAIDDLALRVTQLAQVPDDLTAVKDNTSVILDAVVPLSDNVISARDAAVATLEALNPITDRINEILDKLDSEATYDAEETALDEERGAIDYTDDLNEIKDNLNTILDTLPLLPQSDDLVTARDNTYSILDTLTMMPQTDDLIATRDNVAAVLDAVNALTESVNLVIEGQTGTVAEDVASLKEVVDGTAEDVKAIRQKLEEAPADDVNDTLTAVLQDMGLVLDKLEAFEQKTATDKQDILDAVGDIKEEVHISELGENIAATGVDDETRDVLVGEISEIRERLNSLETTAQSGSDATASALDAIAAQLADLQNAVIAQPEAGAATDVEAVNSDGMQVILDELSALKDKIDAGSEYDTVEEILSLREDVKAARIVDQNDVSGELESIKNELASISSGNILDEIRSLRDEISTLSLGGAETDSAPTNDELNLVLNEIVSLRDEMFAFKDEVLNATTVAEEPADGETDETRTDDVNTILDELTALRADQSALTGNIDELKDMVSRRTSLSTDVDHEASVASDSNELNVVLGEIINLKNDLERVEETVNSDRLDILAEQVEEIRTLIEDMRKPVPTEQSEGEASYTDVDTAIFDRLDEINTAINEIRLGQATVEDTAETSAEHGGVAGEISELRAEIELLRQENEQLRRENEQTIAGGFAELREAIRDMALSQQPAANADGETSYAALIDEIRSLKEQVASVQTATAGIDENTLAAIREAVADQQPVSEELGEIRDEIAQLRSLTTVTAESGSASEVAAIRNELAELKDIISSPDSLVGLAEDVTSIRADVQTLKEEPDLGVINEILALRDEFQSLREQIEDVKNIASKTDAQSDDRILGEVQSLRDQLFAISMANVNDSASGESNYESYNNLILDEISLLRDQVNSAGSVEDIKALSEEIAQMKAAIDKREELYDALSDRVARLNNDATNNKILDELESLRTELANQRDADLTTLNFMSEMAHLLERQNNYLTQNAGTKITDEIESLKAELAATDQVAGEIAKLREIMTQYGNASDNDTILNELAELREELSAEKPSKENEIILQEIARLRDELTVIADREKTHRDEAATSDDSLTDSDLKDSLSDLKDRLNEIAGIVEPEKKAAEKKPAAKKPAAKKSTKSGGAKSTKSSGAKSTAKGRKPAQKRTPKQAPEAEAKVNAEEESKVSVPEQPIDDDRFEAKVADEIAKLDTDDEMSLNPQGPSTSDTLDVADKLAQQVANKLVIEQLVEQLGDGGVDDEHVEEILKDILPQEFSTVAMNEQSDKVRRLANQLVLNKLRDRLGGRNDNNDDKD